jgi:LacI family transcriptional regulator
MNSVSAPDTTARGTIERPLIAIVVDTSVSFDREIIAGAAQYAREVGDWQLYVEEEHGHRLPNLGTWQGHGILASFDDPDVVRSILAAGLPTVAVGGMGCHDPASDIPRVATDHAGVAVLAAEHFLERGLRQFGYYGAVHTATLQWSETRGDAFAARVAEAQFPCARFAARHGPEDWAALQEALGAWLRGLPKPVGVMACDDSRARHVLEACRAQGLRVPHEVAVIGVDDDELICELAVPPLTSIRQAARRIGYEAARLLDARIRPPAEVPPGGRQASENVLVPPVGIVPRASTEMLAVTDPAIARVIETIRERACGGLSVEELAELSGLPRWKLEKRFKGVVGHSIHDDLVRIRLAEAQRLLRGTDLPLKTIAPRCGFRSVPYMITVFRRRFGITPARFRRIERGHTVRAVEDDFDDISADGQDS